MANWNTIDPIIATDPAPKVIFEEASGAVASVRVRVRFTSDTAQTREKDYVVSGANALADLRKLIYADRDTLQGAEALTPGLALTPTAPPARLAAEQAYIDAVSDLAALKYLQGLGVAQAAGTDITGAITNRINAIQSAIDTAPKLNNMLPLTPRR